MGQLNRKLTCVVAVMAGYLGMYSAYVERSGIRCSLGYAQNDLHPLGTDRSRIAELTSANRRYAFAAAVTVSPTFTRPVPSQRPSCP
jgi:hypothetical protein